MMSINLRFSFRYLSMEQVMPCSSLVIVKPYLYANAPNNSHTLNHASTRLKRDSCKAIKSTHDIHSGEPQVKTPCTVPALYLLICAIKLVPSTRPTGVQRRNTHNVIDTGVCPSNEGDQTNEENTQVHQSKGDILGLEPATLFQEQCPHHRREVEGESGDEERRGDRE